MTPITARASRDTSRGRLRRLVLTALALLVSAAGIAAVSPAAPTQAGEAAESGSLFAAVYNDTIFDMELVDTFSEYGWRTLPRDIPPGGNSGAYEMQGSPIERRAWCGNTWANYYNGYFTYKVSAGGHLGKTEYLTFAVSGLRQRGWGACEERQPSFEVYVTSTVPTSWWPTLGGPPPNVVDSRFSYRHNVPYLFDQTIKWNGEGPGVGTPAVVSLGDSTISGEGGRWAGNTNGDSAQRIDAGARWYWDTATGESIPDCHRSKSALVHVGAGMRSANFACSAAMTRSYRWDYGGSRGVRFKPGLDRYCGGVVITTWNCTRADKGQLLDLYHYAQTHNVTDVVLAIGANDFDFSGVVTKCVEIYLEQHLWDTGRRCYNDGIVQSTLSPTKRLQIENDVYNALVRVDHTMRSAGYAKNSYRIVMQNYWSALPSDEDIRIPDDLLRRQSEGGCPVLYADASMLNEVLLPGINDTVKKAFSRFRATGANDAQYLDVSRALVGHRLCEKGVDVIENAANFTGRGTDSPAADKAEWVTQMRLNAADPYHPAEGGHANYWGQLAQRACLRELLARNYAAAMCEPGAGGTNPFGEPTMRVVQTPSP